ncbi:MAG: PAS domain-containing sensor histidine kinase [bacterium]|nr:PAS domain-containing sensor histidine kinase [bacterium]
MTELKEKYKFLLVGVLLAVAVVLTYYFHFILKTHIIFTHFFYIPIILSALFWKRKGLSVAVFLAAILTLSNYFATNKITIDDALRAVMFIAISVVVVILSEKISRREEELQKARDGLEIRVKERTAKIAESAEQLRESEERYKVLIENIDLGVCLIDKDFKLIMENSRFCEMFSLNRDKIKGKHCFEAYNKRDSVCPDCPNIKALASKKAVKEETERICADGTHLPVNISTYPVYDLNNDVKYFIKVIEDISELKKIEQAKRNMIRDISHSLKTPIAMTEMAFDIANSSINTGDKESLVKANRIASENLRRLRKDVNNILQEFSIDVYKDIITKDKNASLNAVIEKVANDLMPLIEEKGLQLDINLLLNVDNVKIDVRDLETILNNLLENAVKFTDKGKISITGKCSEKMVEIEVKDTGCGISEKDIKRVFEKFYKRNAAIEGTGLGLSICKELAEMYDGEINIYSGGVGKGTMVVVSLPKV